MAIRKIYLTNQTDFKPRRQISVDEFSYTVVTVGGEASVTLPGSRTYDTTNSMLRVYANGLKIIADRHYTRNGSTTILASTCAEFPGGKFPKGCVLDFELYTV
jgi:hypothetical protein